jgi:hypothetical protein
MIPHKNHARIAAGVLLLLSADFASAQQTVDDSGIATYVRDNQVYELEKGHIVVLVNEKGILIADDPSLATHNTTSDCIGMFEEFPDGTYKGSGYCTNTDHREGHKLFLRWSATSDTPEGRYEIIGGTGKFEGVKGEGTTTVTELSPGPQGRSVLRWKGSAEYPNLRK